MDQDKLIVIQAVLDDWLEKNRDFDESNFEDLAVLILYALERLAKTKGESNG